MIGKSAFSEFRDGQQEGTSYIRCDFKVAFLWEQVLHGHVMRYTVMSYRYIWGCIHVV